MQISFWNRFLMIRLRKRDTINLNTEMKTVIRVMLKDERGDNEASIDMERKHAETLWRALNEQFGK